MEFYYNMYGGGMGSLNVYLVSATNGATIKLFSKSGDQGQQWHKKEVTIVSADSYKVCIVVIQLKVCL